MMLLAKRVRAESPLQNITSISSAGTSASSLSSVAKIRSWPSIKGPPAVLPSAHPPPDVAEASGCGAVADVSGLRRLAFSAIRSAPDPPVVAVTDSVAGVPEFWGYPGIGRVLEHPAETSTPYFPGDLRSELEIEPAVVDAPAFVG